MSRWVSRSAGHRKEIFLFFRLERCMHSARKREVPWNMRTLFSILNFWEEPEQSGRLELSGILNKKDGCYQEAAACLREAEDANRTKLPGYELLIKGALFRFLAILMAQGKQLPSSETADTMRLKQVLQWISVHYGTKLHVADAANICQCSSSHFMRWFKKMTGQRFTAFLNEYRLNAAAEALRTTEDTVLSISEQCGFDNLSYFNRAFKTRYLMTPREYRRK